MQVEESEATLVKQLKFKGVAGSCYCKLGFSYGLCNGGVLLTEGLDFKLV